jgi:hypothetical protein
MTRYRIMSLTWNRSSLERIATPAPSNGKRVNVLWKPIHLVSGVTPPPIEKITLNVATVLNKVVSPVVAFVLTPAVGTRREFGVTKSRLSQEWDEQK